MNPVLNLPTSAAVPLPPPCLKAWLAPAAQTDVLRVFVADDHAIFRYGVKSVLAGQSHMVLVGEAADGREAVRAAPAVEPDVVLMDLEMPHLDGIGAILALRPLLPDARFVVVAGALDVAAARRALAAGATSFVLKSSSPQELLTVIQASWRGQRVMAPEVTHALALGEQNTTLGGDLTQRERDLLALMSQGMSNREIAQRLRITMPTVKFHVTHILSKMQAPNRTSAVLSALRHRVVCLD